MKLGHRDFDEQTLRTDCDYIIERNRLFDADPDDPQLYEPPDQGPGAVASAVPGLTRDDLDALHDLWCERLSRRNLMWELRLSRHHVDAGVAAIELAYKKGWLKRRDRPGH